MPQIAAQPFQTHWSATVLVATTLIAVTLTLLAPAAAHPHAGPLTHALPAFATALAALLYVTAAVQWWREPRAKDAA